MRRLYASVLPIAVIVACDSFSASDQVAASDAGDSDAGVASDAPAEKFCARQADAGDVCVDFDTPEPDPSWPIVTTNGGDEAAAMSVTFDEAASVSPPRSALFALKTSSVVADDGAAAVIHRGGIGSFSRARVDFDVVIEKLMPLDQINIVSWYWTNDSGGTCVFGVNTDASRRVILYWKQDTDAGPTFPVAISEQALTSKFARLSVRWQNVPKPTVSLSVDGVQVASGDAPDCVTMNSYDLRIGIQSFLPAVDARTRADNVVYSTGL